MSNRVCNPVFRFMGFLRESPPLHFYLVQFVAFAYLIYRFASRDYTIYGFLPEEAFSYLFDARHELTPIPPTYFFTFQFLYLFVDHPSPDTIEMLQYIVIGSAGLGLLGIYPKINAMISFVLAIHITGILQSCDAPMDGGTLALSAMFVLAVAPKNSFYGVENGYSLKRLKSVDFHWPVTLLFVLVGAFYTFSGLAKVIDIGPHWPFALHLENLAETTMERRLFVTARYSEAFIFSFCNTPLKSIFAGLVVLIGEVFFICVLWLRRERVLFVTSMIALHVIVYYSAGINFLGSSVILLLLFDYNRLQRKLTVNCSPKNALLFLVLKRSKCLDVFDLIQLNESMEQPYMRAWDENGEQYEGADTLEQVFLRIPVLFPLGVLMQVPGIIYVARKWVDGQINCEVDSVSNRLD